MHSLFKLSPSQQAERERLYNAAKAIAALEETEGWRHFVEAANSLALAHTPDVSVFTPEQATTIASQLAFASGVKRCIGLIEQKKREYESLKKERKHND